MSQTKNSAHRRMRLAALVLALALLLVGCAPAVDIPAEESTAGEFDNAALAEAESESPSIEPEETSSGDAQEPSLKSDLVECEEIEISEGELREIDHKVAEMQTQYIAGPGGADSLVEERDWSVYTSELSKEKLPAKEAEFYGRLDAMCMEYLGASALSGVRIKGKNGIFYATSSVRYSDLGLTDQQAVDKPDGIRYA